MGGPSFQQAAKKNLVSMPSQHGIHTSRLANCVFQDELKCTYFLWQLFHIDQDLAKGLRSLAKEEKEQEAAAHTAIVVEKQIESKRKEQAGFHLERVKLERQLKRKRTDVDQKVQLLCVTVLCCHLHERKKSLYWHCNGSLYMQ